MKIFRNITFHGITLPGHIIFHAHHETRATEDTAVLDDDTAGVDDNPIPDCNKDLGGRESWADCDMLEDMEDRFLLANDTNRCNFLEYAANGWHGQHCH